MGYEWEIMEYEWNIIGRIIYKWRNHRKLHIIYIYIYIDRDIHGICHGICIGMYWDIIDI